jgi:hypothetical protein
MNPVAEAAEASARADRILSITAAPPMEPNFDQVSIGVDPASGSADIFVGSADGRWERLGTANNVQVNMQTESPVHVRPGSPLQTTECYHCGGSVERAIRQRVHGNTVLVCRHCYDHRNELTRRRELYSSHRINAENALSQLAGLETNERVLAGPTSDEMEANYRV